ncbi:hypothetical protein [Alteribacillus sp. HJP-4]|uniref:hypothetical protein n=1 Tax=Alteribacillus sp. HJP-4 TaxID=2775394 RepID=UPI0035CCEF4E
MKKPTEKPVKEPLYYIEQPAFEPKPGPNQSIAVSKVSSKQRKPKREKQGTSASQKFDKKSAPPVSESAVSASEEKNIKEAAVIEPPNTNVKEMLRYVQSLPHFIQPVIACETEEKSYQGYFIAVENGELKLRNRRNRNHVSIKIEEVIDIYVVSL